MTRPENERRENPLRVFSSFDEENEATAKIFAARSPEENFRIALEMIRAMYKNEPEDQARSDNRITFTVIDGFPVK